LEGVGIMIFFKGAVVNPEKTGRAPEPLRMYMKCKIFPTPHQLYVISKQPTQKNINKFTMFFLSEILMLINRKH